MGCLRRADADFGMIQNGDRIAVGVSGGKDSLALVYCLELYKRFSKKDYEIYAVTVDTGLRPFDLSGVREFMSRLGVHYEVIETNAGEVVFSLRQEKNPCALCAKMRRGALNELATEHGCNKLALGHHRDDAIETLLMSLFFEGRLHTFHPVTCLSRSGITVIRPMIYVPEKDIIHEARVQRLPIVKSPCPANGHTARQDMKDLLTELTKRYPFVRERLLSALQNTAQYGLWDQKRSGSLTASETPGKEE